MIKFPITQNKKRIHEKFNVSELLTELLIKVNNAESSFEIQLNKLPTMIKLTFVSNPTAKLFSLNKPKIKTWFYSVYVFISQN